MTNEESFQYLNSIQMNLILQGLYLKNCQVQDYAHYVSICDSGQDWKYVIMNERFRIYNFEIIGIYLP